MVKNVKFQNVLINLVITINCISQKMVYAASVLIMRLLTMIEDPAIDQLVNLDNNFLRRDNARDVLIMKNISHLQIAVLELFVP